MQEVIEAMEVIKEKNVKLPKEPGENLVEVNSEEINYVKVMASKKIKEYLSFQIQVNSEKTNHIKVMA